MIWLGIVVGLAIGLMVWLIFPRKVVLLGPPPKPEPEPHLMFDLLMKLLSRRDDWTPGTHYITHKSGLKLWTENRDYGDMRIWNGKFDEESDKMFTAEERDLLRTEADKVIRDWKWAHGEPLTLEESMMLQIKNWDTEDPELKEIQQVL